MLGESWEQNNEQKFYCCLSLSFLSLFNLNLIYEPFLKGVWRMKKVCGICRKPKTKPRQILEAVLSWETIPTLEEGGERLTRGPHHRFPLAPHKPSKKTPQPPGVHEANRRRRHGLRRSVPRRRAPPPPAPPQPARPQPLSLVPLPLPPHLLQADAQRPPPAAAADGAPGPLLRTPEQEDRRGRGHRVGRLRVVPRPPGRAARADQERHRRRHLHRRGPHLPGRDLLLSFAQSRVKTQHLFPDLAEIGDCLITHRSIDSAG